jgi:hypothetical protein
MTLLASKNITHYMGRYHPILPAYTNPNIEVVLPIVSSYLED